MKQFYAISVCRDEVFKQIYVISVARDDGFNQFYAISLAKDEDFKQFYGISVGRDLCILCEYFVNTHAKTIVDTLVNTL